MIQAELQTIVVQKSASVFVCSVVPVVVMQLLVM